MTEVREAWRLWPTTTALRLLVVGAVGFFLLLSLQQAGSLYVIDEAEFPYIGEATARTGIPVYYHGELRPTDVGIFHPPLYVYLLAGWIEVFGDSHVAVRCFGVLCQLLTAAFVMATVRLLFPRRADLLSSIALLLYLTNPFVIASGLLPDIDGTVGVLALAAAVHVLVLIVLSSRPTRREVLLAGVTFGFALSTKLTTPLALAPLMLVAFAVSRRGWLATGRDYLLSLVIGVTLFLAWWGTLAGLSTWMQFSYPFKFTYTSLTTKSGAASLHDRLVALRPLPMTLFWLDPILIMMTAAVLAGALWAWRSPRARAVAIICAFALGTIVAYDVITTPVFRFPKYWIAAVPAATIACVSALGWTLENAHVTWRRRYSPLLLGSGLAVGVALTIVSLQRKIPTVTDMAPVRELVPTLFVIAVLAALAIVAMRTRGGRTALVAFPVVAALLSAVLLHGTALASIQRSADYETRYYYGERGFSQVVADVRALSVQGRPIMAPKDVGFETGLPFYEDGFYLPDPSALDDLLSSGKIELVVTRKNFDYSEIVFPDAFALIRRRMDPIVDRPGSGFTVWRLKPEGRPGA
jgi:4-amino-4-deoxy-L-arabinose transferase-like glycosyltransferase